jgi:hypothetical protein
LPQGDAEQMQSVGMARLGLQNVAVKTFSVVDATGTMQLKGFFELGSGGRKHRTHFPSPWRQHHSEES